MIDRILNLLKMRGATAKELARILGLNSGVVTDWKRGKATPSANSILMMADYFGVTTDYILRGESGFTAVNNNNSVFSQSGNISNVSTAGSPQLSPEAAELVRIFEKLDVKKRMRILSLAIESEDGAL